MKNKIIVAIDGFSSCGKSTVAKQLASYSGDLYVDTGAMYRAVALWALRLGWISEKKIYEENLLKNIENVKIEFKKNSLGEQEIFLNDENVEKQIRTLEVSNAASKVSTLKFVREKLVDLQQKMGENRGIVMDGRDIGTVVFPSAELKIFLTATPEVRARRRFEELQEKGISESFEAVLANVKERDKRDTTRKESPLRQASDAVLIDNSAMTKEAQLEKIIELFQARTAE